MKERSRYRIKIVADGEEWNATLNDTECARDFIKLLPLDLTLKDYAGTEKISDLPVRLSTEGAPEGFDPSVGDITYYAPWGNLAVFYKDFGYSGGLVSLGSIDGDIGLLANPEPIAVRIEMIK